jgi:hypothetical protein
MAANPPPPSRTDIIAPRPHDPAPDRPRIDWPWRILCSLIIVGIVAAVLVTLIAAPPPFDGEHSREDATIWVTALAAVGTLGAVRAAVRAAREASDRAEELQRHAQERGDAEHAQTIAHEERIRHDNLRPIISVFYDWAPGLLTLHVTNDGPAVARGLRFAIEDAGGAVIPLGYRVWYEGEGTKRTPLPSGRPLRPYAFRGATNQSVLEYEAAGEEIQAGAQIYLACRYEDALGWVWRHRVALPLSVEYAAGQHEQRLWHSLGAPERVTDDARRPMMQDHM